MIGGNIATAEAALALVEGRCGWRQGRYRSRFDLHHAYRRRCRCAADQCGGQCRGSAEREWCAVDCRRWYPLLRRYGQGHRRRRAFDHGWQHVCRYRRSAGRSRTVPGSFLQILSWHGFAGCHVGSAGFRRIVISRKTMPPEKLVPEGIEGRVPYKGPLSSRDSSIARWSALQHGLYRLSATSKRCAPSRSSSA